MEVETRSVLNWYEKKLKRGRGPSSEAVFACKAQAGSERVAAFERAIVECLSISLCRLQVSHPSVEGGKALWYQTGIFLPLGNQVLVVTDGSLLRTEFLKHHTTAFMISLQDGTITSSAKAHETFSPWTNDSSLLSTTTPESITLVRLNSEDEGKMSAEPLSLRQLWDPDAHTCDDGYFNLDRQLFVLQPPEEGTKKWHILKLYLIRAVAANEDTIEYRFDPREDREVFPGSPLVTVDEADKEVVCVGLHNGRGKDKEWHHRGTLLVPFLFKRGLLDQGDKAGMGRRGRVSTYEACRWDPSKFKAAGGSTNKELRLQASPRPTLSIPREQYGLSASEAARMEFRSAYMMLRLLEDHQDNLAYTQHVIMSLGKLVSRSGNDTKALSIMGKLGVCKAVLGAYHRFPHDRQLLLGLCWNAAMLGLSNENALDLAGAGLCQTLCTGMEHMLDRGQEDGALAIWAMGALVNMARCRHARHAVLKPAILDVVRFILWGTSEAKEQRPLQRIGLLFYMELTRKRGDAPLPHAMKMALEHGQVPLLLINIARRFDGDEEMTSMCRLVARRAEVDLRAPGAWIEKKVVKEEKKKDLQWWKRRYSAVNLLKDDSLHSIGLDHFYGNFKGY